MPDKFHDTIDGDEVYSTEFRLWAIFPNRAVCYRGSDCPGLLTDDLGLGGPWWTDFVGLHGTPERWVLERGGIYSPFD